MTSSPSPQRGRPTYPVRVVDAALATPCMRRVTFEGEGMTDLESPLPAQWMKVVLAPPEAAVRPNRAYTIRELDAKRRRVVMDFVLHGDAGPLSAWASRAQVGDGVHLGAPRGGHRIEPAARWRLLAGDETALPAISAILQALPPDDVPTQVLVEVPGAEDAQPLRAPVNGRVDWLARGGASRYGQLLEAAIAAVTLPGGPGQVFLAGDVQFHETGRRPPRARRAHGRERLLAPRRRRPPGLKLLDGVPQARHEGLRAVQLRRQDLSLLSEGQAEPV